MAITQVIDERTTAYLQVDFLDKDGAAAVPSTVSYRIDDITDAGDYAAGTQIRAPTSVSPAASVEITLDASDTTILSPASSFERRRVTVTATFGAGDEINSQYFFIVRNLGGV